MSQLNVNAIVLALLIFLNHSVSAQSEPSNNLMFSREVIVYDENFVDNISNNFPKKWHTILCMNRSYIKNEGVDRWVILDVDSNKVLHKNGSYVHASPDFCLPMDSFSVDVSFRFVESNAEISIGFLEGEHEFSCGAEACCRKSSIYIGSDGQVNTPLYGVSAIEVGNCATNLRGNHTYKLLKGFSNIIWHNIVISYCSGKLSLVVDGTLVFDMAEFQYRPRNIIFGALRAYEISNLSISTGPFLQQFDDLNRKKSLVTRAIRFKTGSSKIEKISELYLTQLAAYLTKNPRLRLRIIGHTDNTGIVADNIKLSTHRALAVKEWLIRYGKIAPNRLEVNGMGSSKPISLDNSDYSNSLNRRVEFVPY